MSVEIGDLVSAETAKDPVFVLQSHSSILGAYIIGEDALAAVL